MEAFSFAYRMGRTIFDSTRVAEVSSLVDCVSKESDIAKLDLASFGVRPPVPNEPGCLCNVGTDTNKHHILVAGDVSRCSTNLVVRRRWNSPVPPGSFNLVGPGIYMSTPEFIYLQLASCLSDVQLALAGCALCSKYRLSPEKGIVEAKPLSSVGRLGDFLQNAQGAFGVKRARRVLPYVAGDAESPMEVDMYASTCFPWHMGGQGAPKATLNYKVEVNAEDAEIVDRAERTSWRIDMCWPELKKGVEYLGKDHETTPNQDRERINALTSKGYSVLQYTYKDLVGAQGKNRRITQIARLLELPEHVPTRKEIYAREDLERELYGPARFRL